MKISILAGFLFTMLTISSFAGEMPGVLKSSWDIELGSGQFCNVESAEVCVLTQSEEDCKKLAGEKVDVCPSSQEQE